MKVYNKSSKDQKFRINDRYGNTYVVYIKAGRSTELEPSQVSEDVLKLISEGVLVDVTNGIKATVIEATPNDVSPVNDQEDKPTNVDIECACEDENKESITEETEVSTDEPSQVSEDVESDEETKPSEEVVEPSPDTFVCPICGKEYATQRGLTMHTNKEHKED